VTYAHILTTDPELADELTRLALLAAVPVSRGSAPHDVPDGTRLVLAGAEMLPLAAAPSELLVVTRQEPSVALFEAALAAGARGLARLPEHEARVVQELVAAEGNRGEGRVLAVVGGSGGVGASGFAAACALAAAPALLVDCDPLGGGLDALLGIEAEPGPRWSGLREAKGRLSASTLREALPGLDGVAVLAHDGAAVPGAALAAVVSAGLESGSVVLDLPRTGAGWLLESGVRVDELLLVVADDVAGVLAARRVSAAFRATAGRTRVALLRSERCLDADTVSRALDAEVALTLPARPSGRRCPSRAWVRAAARLLR
jgi:secretion/DNA translocation related CpaE-like protein